MRQDAFMETQSRKPHGGMISGVLWGFSVCAALLDGVTNPVTILVNLKTMSL